METTLSLATTTFGLGAGGGIGFFFVKWLFEYLGGRMDKRADRLDAGTDKLIGRLQEQVDKLSQRLEKVEGDLAECKQRHAESDAEVMRLKAIMQGRGEMRDRAAVLVAAEKLAERKGEG